MDGFTRQECLFSIIFEGVTVAESNFIGNVCADKVNLRHLLSYKTIFTDPNRSQFPLWHVLLILYLLLTEVKQYLCFNLFK